MKKELVIIAGDSWACGEWIDGNNTHTGLRQFLTDEGYSTLCFGYPGAGNLVACEYILQFVAYNKELSISKIIFFQTDWLRDLKLHRLFSDSYLDVFEKGYQYARNWYVSSFYHRLAMLYSTYQVPSVVIGGLGDTIWLDKFDQEYPGVSIGCQSFTNLIVNNNHRIDIPVYSMCRHEELIKKMKLYSSIDDTNELMLDMEFAIQRDNTFMSRNDLFPDNRHPNRIAHQKLYQHLKSSMII